MAKEVDAAIGIVIENSESHGWRILITRRPDQTVYGGYWELPGGKIEPGETPEACVRRELLEEVGLTVRVDRELPGVEHTYVHAHVRLRPFFCTRVTGEPRNLHVAEHRWVTPDELKGFRFLPANGPLLETICTILSDKAPLRGSR